MTMKKRNKVCIDIIMMFHILSVIAWATRFRVKKKKPRAVRGAENPMGPKLPDFILLFLNLLKVSIVLYLDFLC